MGQRAFPGPALGTDDGDDLHQSELTSFSSINWRSTSLIEMLRPVYRVCSPATRFRYPIWARVKRTRTRRAALREAPPDLGAGEADTAHDLGALLGPQSRIAPRWGRTGWRLAQTGGYFRRVRNTFSHAELLLKRQGVLFEKLSVVLQVSFL